jgi:aryl-alcohol dehydrogenase
MKIEAAVLRMGSAELSRETIELEEPRPNEILVRLVATGVCHTDIKMAESPDRVPRPIVLGHEGAGIVERVGSAVAKVAAGDHVVMSYDYCGACPSCLEDDKVYCHNMGAYNFGGRRADGTSALSKGGELIGGSFFGQSSFADFAICTERNVVKVRKDAPLELLGPLGCGIQTGAGAVLNALRVQPGKTIAVFGVGSVGLSGIMAARLAGAAKIIAVDVVTERLAMASELGATHIVNARDSDARDEIMGITGYGVDYAFDTTGVAAVQLQALASLAPRGTCGFVATPPGPLPVEMMHLMAGGRKLVGIIEGESTPDVFIPMMIDFYLQGRFPFDRLVKFYPFDGINEAIHDSNAGRTIKPIVRFSA